MDRAAVQTRLRESGLDEHKVVALTNLLWNVNATGRLDEADFARLGDAGFRHVDECIMRELLTVALSRRWTLRAAPLDDLLGAFERRSLEATSDDDAATD